jgi:orotidine-5'-phosphate decarboxylase
LADQLIGVGLKWFKVGLGLWIHDGQRVVSTLRSRGARVFLDLKLHDIPHQVRLATQAAAELGVDLLTVHAAGGAEMMSAAAEGAAGKTRLLAITVLTSLDADPSEVVARADLASASGMDGVVCSPLEAEALRARHASPFLLVTPGVRPAGSARGDQRRVATPEQALSWGADHLVIGRPITQADDPCAVVQRLLNS